MVKKSTTCLILLLVLLISSFTFSQQNKIEEKKNELSDIKKQISSLEAEVQRKSRKERETYATLSNYDQQSFLLEKLIDKIHDEEQKKIEEISISQKEIKKLESDIKRLKANYSKYVVSIYKHGNVNKWTILFDSDSFEQAILRIKYLQKFSERRQKDLEQLKESKKKLITVRKRLRKEKRDKEVLARQKEREEKDLMAKAERSKKILAAIRNDKKELKNEIDAKKDAEEKIKNMIARLIEEERKRQEETRGLANTNKNLKSGNPDETGSYDIDLSTDNFASFSSLKGKLNWPVRSAKVVRQFGENRNSKLNTVTLNYGIDLKVSGDKNVKAIAEGVVSVIDWIPAYGSVVIITHKGDYRTVYSHLEDIAVREGDRVKSGSLIGKVDESLEGNILHFEIWNSRDHQDPLTWLAPK
jgi:septal ring factor EnvC (AmiA/AmiB activator)